jgi:NTP pyrophosphatase (non-canonical NTP hydrolase)
LFSIGDPVKDWPGLAKLVEEMGELNQVLGKLMAYPDEVRGKHPDGYTDITKLIEEMGDVQAALRFFTVASGLPGDRIKERADMKFEKFWYWHNQGPERNRP